MVVSLDHSALIWSCYATAMILTFCRLLKIAQTWFLGYWASLYETGGHVIVGRCVPSVELG